jgi:hypothetical protein
MEHEHAGESTLDAIIEITFGMEHMFAEFFWNIVFALAVWGLSKAKLFSSVHKYIDTKHKITHKPGEY